MVREPTRREDENPIGVPLIQNGIAVGVISLVRTHVRPFAQKQINLVTTFADQAVIAIENTRLFEEVQARTREVHGGARISHCNQRRARRHLSARRPMSSRYST